MRRLFELSKSSCERRSSSTEKRDRGSINPPVPGKRSGKALRNNSCEGGLVAYCGLAVRRAGVGLCRKETVSMSGDQATIRPPSCTEETMERHLGRVPAATFGDLPRDALLTAAEV